jgi:MOSC domain-containing protein YiiM|tara:strand:+ start:3101 stop:3757 length:657 start_codon:yes stop_codon:yes gene_type:complete
MQLHSIQIGKAQTLGDPDKAAFFKKTWSTGIYKSGVSGPVAVGHEGIVGDEQADLTVHGGPDKALCVYSLDHYAYWKAELGLEFSPGAFGENLTVADINESDVCIGDIYHAGTAVFQVTQPRQPCWKLARRWEVKAMPALVQKTGKTGWYFRVLETGNLSAPAKLERSARPHPNWTVARANAVMHDRKTDSTQTKELAQLDALSKSWRESLHKRLGNR